MKLYFVTHKYFGKQMTLEPRVPKSLDEEGEDNKTPRICTSNSMLGCVFSISKNYSPECFLYVYTCEVEDFY